MCTYVLVYAHCVYLYYPISLLLVTCVRIIGVFEDLHAWVGGGWKCSLFQLVHGHKLYQVLVAGVGGYVSAGVEIGGLSCILLYF